ncbi:MAG: M48 family metallopeptidase [Alphaproteobacteria bacterium]
MSMPRCFRPVLALTAVLALAGCGGGGGSTGLGLNVVDPAQIDQMGVETWQAIKSETPASADSAKQAEARQIADRILRALGENPQQWDVQVFASDEVNAFALPGRKIGVYEGMFAVADTPDQMAAVVAHEVSHVEAAHAAQRVNTEVGTQLAAQIAGSAAAAAGVGTPETVAQIVGVGAQYGVTLPYSRNQELEADKLGLRAMARAGYDPRAAVDLWQKMSRQGPRPPTFASTHPAPQDRIAALKAEMPAALALYQQR